MGRERRVNSISGLAYITILSVVGYSTFLLGLLSLSPQLDVSLEDICHKHRLVEFFSVIHVSRVIALMCESPWAVNSPLTVPYSAAWCNITHVGPPIKQITCCGNDGLSVMHNALSS